MTERTEKLLARCSQLKISVCFKVLPFFKGFRFYGFKFEGENEDLMIRARNYMCLHDDILHDIAEQSGYSYNPAKTRGALVTPHEYEVWRAFIAPITYFERDVSLYWHDWRYLYYLEHRATDFYTMWLNETTDKDRLTFWRSEKFEGFDEAYEAYKNYQE